MAPGSRITSPPQRPRAASSLAAREVHVDTTTIARATYQQAQTRFFASRNGAGFSFTSSDPCSMELDDDVRAEAQRGFWIIAQAQRREQRQNGVVVAREDRQTITFAVEELAP